VPETPPDSAPDRGRDRDADDTPPAARRIAIRPAHETADSVESDVTVTGAPASRNGVTGSGALKEKP